MNTLITGATRGIGRAVATRLAAASSKMLLVARNEALLEDTRSELQSHSARLQVHTCSADLGQADAIEKISKRAADEAFNPDVLILNAGLFVGGDLGNSPSTALRLALEVNLVANYELVQAFLPALKRSERPRIVLIGSTAALEPFGGGPIYSVAKWGLRGYARNLRDELMSDGIGVTHVVPGNTLTAAWDGIDVPADRLLRAEDIAEMVHATLSLSPQAVVDEVIVRPMLG